MGMLSYTWKRFAITIAVILFTTYTFSSQSCAFDTICTFYGLTGIAITVGFLVTYIAFILGIVYFFIQLGGLVVKVARKKNGNNKKN